jgi:RecB family exonuclease
MAILHPGDDHSASLVHHHIQAAELPSNGAVSDRLADRVAGRTLLALLSLAGAPAPRRADVFAILGGAPVRSVGIGHVPSVAWERLSREAGVVGTARTDWDVQLTRLAQEKQQEAEAKEADDRSGLARRLRRDAEQALALRDFVLGLLDRLDVLRRASTWASLAAEAGRLLHEHLGREHQRTSWPEPERDAADKVEAALERLAHLERVAPTPDLARFERTLRLELDADLGRRGRFGEGVLVGRVGLALGLELDLVVICGLAEGVLPTRQRDDALLPDRDRVAAGDELPAAADRQRREHRELLAAVAAARQEVVLTMPRGDLRRTTEHVASRWLTELVDVHHHVRLFSEELLLHQAPWLQHVPSFVGGLRSAPWPATEQEARLGLVLHGQRQPADVAFERATALVAARARPELTAYDGHLVGLTIPSPASSGQVVSPTRLEAWAICPYAYFVRYLLDVEPVEDPEELLVLPAIEQGILVHRALDGYIDERITEGAGLEPDLAQLGRHFELACRAAEARGVTGRSVLWRHQRDELRRHLEAFVVEDAQRCRDEGSLPLATELRFGFPGAPVDAIEVGIGGGRTLRFRGSADRVDRAGDGHLVVTDYKYSSTYKYRSLGADDPTAAGSLLQLPIYGLAAQAVFDAGKLPLPVTARYAFVKPDASRGTLPAPATLDIDEPLLERWSETLTVIAEGIEAGVFVARPGEDTRFAGFIGCLGCDPDGLGTADLQRRWARKQRSPELAAYLRLLGAEPDDDADDADDVEGADNANVARGEEAGGG